MAQVRRRRVLGGYVDGSGGESRSRIDEVRSEDSLVPT